MITRFLVATLLAAFLILPAGPARAQSTIYEWGAVANLGFGILNQFLGVQRQAQGGYNGYSYGHNGGAFATGQPGWHLQGQQGRYNDYSYGGGGYANDRPGWHLQGQNQWGHQSGWGQQQWSQQQCRGELMQDQTGRRAIVDPCSGRVLQWVR